MKGRAGWVGGCGAAIAAALVVFIVSSRSSAPEASQAPAAQGIPEARPAAALAARLLIYPGAPGDEALGVVRLYDARVRNGFSTDGATVLLSRAALEPGLRIETQDAAGTGTPASPIAIVQTPADTPVRFDRDTTHEVWISIRDVRPAASVRITMAVGGTTVATSWVDVPAPPASRVEQLAARARGQSLRQADGLLETGDQLVAAAPNDWRGHYYRGLALETRGDATGAIVALQSAMDRVELGSEPPLALSERLAPLRARSR